MDLLTAWILFPLALVLLTGGIGLLFERAAGSRLPGALVVPLGLAGLIVVAQLTTATSATAPTTTWAAALLAVAGFALGRERLRDLRDAAAPVAAAGGVFLVFAAPVVLTGEATFAGYGVLGDTAIQFLGVDQLLEHGRTLDGLAPSSFQIALDSYFRSGYPFGAQVGLGAVRPLAGLDVAWVYQPYLAFLVATVALSLWALGEGLVRSAPARAAIAFVAAQPALVFAYALQGSIKEIATTAVVTLLVALVGPLLRPPAGARTGAGAALRAARATIPLAVAAAAAFAAIGPAAATWVAPVLLCTLVWRLLERPPLPVLAAQAAVFAAVTAVLAIPVLTLLGGYAEVTTTVVTAKEELGNLESPLNPLQAAGVWISSDYRFDPGAGLHLGATRVLVAVALASAVAGLAWCWRRRARTALLYVGVSLLACAVVLRAGSPWAAAKALTIASPAVLFAAMLGVAALAQSQRRWRVPALALGASLAAGVLLSNALAYRAASPAPRERLAELERIGERHGERGPILYTEFEEYGKHFLRAGDPVGVTEAFLPDRNGAPRIGGAGLHFGYGADLDDVALPFALRHRTVVLRRSPVASRPPSGYRLVERGDWYDVWQRGPAAPAVLQHVALGSPEAASAVPRCADVRALARSARRQGAVLAVAPRPRPLRFDTAAVGERSGRWKVDARAPATLVTSGEGRVAGTLSVPSGGRYAAWLGGSFGAPVSVRVDGRRVGEVGDELSGRGQYARIRGPLELSAGDHAVELVREPRSLGPGQTIARRVGPLVLVPAADAGPPEVRRTDPARWRSLCGESYDWIEIVR